MKCPVCNKGVLKRDKENVHHDELLLFSRQIAREAGKRLLKRFGAVKPLQKITRDKGLLTVADLESDAFLREAIGKRYPSHTIITEENMEKKGAVYTWIIDPLDGTTNFSRHDPHFSVAICIQEKGEEIIGVVFLPALDELYFAQKGKGAFLEKNGLKKLQVSSKQALGVISFATSFDWYEEKKADALIKDIRRAPLFNHMRRRVLESSAYELCCVAQGQSDAYLCNKTSSWDVLSGALIVKEAGGRYSFVDKKKMFFIAANQELYAPLVQLIKKYY